MSSTSLVSRDVASIDEALILHRRFCRRDMSTVQCIADRFVMIDRRDAIDIATGRTTKMIVSTASGAEDQLKWAKRCDEIYQRHVLDGPNLVDYGQFGRSSTFEAWSEAAQKPLSDAPSVRHVERPVESALAELFDVDSRQPRVVYLSGPSGCGKSTLLLRLARCARLQGFVPLSIDLLDSPLAAIADGRSVLLLDDERGGGEGALVGLMLRSARPHVLLHAATDDSSRRSNVALRPLSAGALRSSVAGDAPWASGADARRAAERACGNPGRFIALMRGVRAVSRRTHVRVISKAAERAPVYGVVGPAEATVWPVPAEIAALRRHMEDGLSHLNNGRHAPGERLLRKTIGSLSRRGEWAAATDGTLALAASLLKRGRARDAKTLLDGARDSCRRVGRDGTVIAAAALAGTALIDLAQLEEAETVLAAAHTVAGHIDDRSTFAAVAAALARCRFWRGQYADASETLRVLFDAHLDDALRVRVDVMRTRLAIAFDDVAAAVATAADTVQRVASAGQQLLAEAAYGAALAHSAVGDLAAVRHDVAICASAARAARDPLRHLRAQLILCEQLRRAGQRNEALRVLAPLRRIPASALPRIVRARRDLIVELLDAESGWRDILSRHIAASGLQALALLVPKSERPTQLRGRFTSPVDDALEVLRICQIAADETTTLAAVCEQVQRQTHAAAVGIFGVEYGRLARLAVRGARLETATAQRAVDAGVFVGPHDIDDRHEAAMPICYGDAVIGTLAMRWVIGSTTDPERVGAVASMAAAAAAPVLAAALASRRRSESSVVGELLGASRAMVEVRQLIERTAPAPFGVLVEGESGSGKELVARAIHRAGSRRDRPFVTLNCAALPDDLVESELFGHARGAFTGAITERVGVFEEAHTGTLFLDEVGELSPRAQAKVLRVIQESELRRVGENISRRVDVRLVAATNRDLRLEAAAGRFRLDLLYRLDVIRITVPPLRERSEDIPLLADHIWREAAARCGSRATLGAPIIAALARYHWPGNVRELQNVLAALVVRAGRRGIVPVSALPRAFTDGAAQPSCRLEDARRTFDENFVRAALVRCGGRRAEAAGELGLSRQGLSKLMARLGIAEGALS